LEAAFVLNSQCLEAAGEEPSGALQQGRSKGQFKVDEISPV